MSTVKVDDSQTGLPALAVEDKYRGRVTFVRTPGHPDGFVVEVVAAGAVAIGLDVDDALALLSFFADAAGVERYVPQVELRDVAVVAQPLHPSWTVERVDDPAPGGAS